jgi:uncharacterized membrane protein
MLSTEYGKKLLCPATWLLYTLARAYNVVEVSEKELQTRKVQRGTWARIAS